MAYLASALALSPEEKDDLSKIETYLNGVLTLKSRFIQTSSDGEVVEGDFYLSRPGKMRFEYDPPSPILLIANGFFVIYVNNQAEQVTHIPIRNTPLRLLLERDVNLREFYVVNFVKRGHGTLTLMLSTKDDSNGGRVKLFFSDNPVALRQWFIRDAQGVEIRVSLLGVERGLSFDPRLFQLDVEDFDDVEATR